MEHELSYKIEKMPDIDVHKHNFMLQNSFEQLHGGILLGNTDSVCKQFKHLGKYIVAPENANGFLLYIPSNVASTSPIHIDCCCDSPANLRNFIILEAGSSAKIMISYHTKIGWERGEVNDNTEIILNKAANLEMTRLSDVKSLTSETTVQQDTSSHMKTYFVSKCKRKLYNKLRVNLNGKNAIHTVCSLSITQHDEYIDNNVQIVHAAPECASSQLFKHILSNASKGAFTGRIIVNKESQKTKAYQRSSNILLNSRAKMNISPQLEIYADDVKCSHGATVGQLDEQALFYLRSRGIDNEIAKKMLLSAFAEEVINDISCKQFRNLSLKMANIEKMFNII